MAAPIVEERDRRSGQAGPDSQHFGQQAGQHPEQHVGQQAGQQRWQDRAGRLARGRARLRRRIAALAGGFVAAKAWERLGYVRLHDYAIERLGRSGRAVYDLARTDAALAELPRIDAALRRGALSWTKARLLARVASAADEEAWLALAGRCSAEALAHRVRRVDRACLEAGGHEVDEDGIGDFQRATFEVRCTPRVNAKWWSARHAAQRVAGESLSPAACAEAIAAEVLSGLPRDVLAAELPPAEPLERTSAGGSLPSPAVRSPARRRSDAAEDPFVLDRRLRRALVLEDRLDARLAPCLRAVADAHSWRGLGFRSFGAYAREQLGISPRRAQALVHLERAADRSPALARAWHGGELSWVRAQTLLPVLRVLGSDARGEEWIARAIRITVRRLEQDVGEALVRRGTDPEAFARSGGLPAEVAEHGAAAAAEDGGPPAMLPGDTEQLAGGAEEQGTPQPAGMQIGANSTGSAETSRVFCVCPVPVARLLEAVHASVRRHLERETGRLPTPGEGLEWMLDHVLAAWSPERQRPERDPREERVYERDDWRCTVPGCSSRRSLHAHHVRFRSAGGSDDLANLTTLCAWHHHRGIHARLLRCAGRAAADLRFALGIRPDGSAVERFGPGDVRLG
jgi:5-methylcytosine-specific restriction endonuclease McrA